MAAIAAPSAPVPIWWEPARCQRVTADAAQAVLACLERLRSPVFFVGRLTVPAVLDPSVGNTIPERHAAHRVLPHLQLDKFSAEGVRMGQVLDRCGGTYVYSQRVEQGTWSPTLLFTCISRRPATEVTAEILRYCRDRLTTYWQRVGGNPESWRRLRVREDSAKVITGEPLVLEIVSGPHASVLLDLGVEHLAPGFTVGFQANPELAARSAGVEQLLQLLEKSFGDVGVLAAGAVSALHLAALSGDPAAASAVAARVAALQVGPLAWPDADGRTPLHYAALFDSAELMRVLLSVCSASATDKWGRTALDVANDLDHCSASAVLQGRPWSLKELSGQKVRRSLHDGTADAETLNLLKTTELSELIPLHDYRAWSSLSAGSSVVDPSVLLRSMSCLECWYGDVLNRKCSAALPSHLELIRVWDDLSTFQPPTEAASPHADVAVLAEATGPRKAPTVADRATFLKRFHARTGFVFAGFDWTNVLMIGGMVLACLVADDEEYARDFCETDVDLYIVSGSSGGLGKPDAACGGADDNSDDNSSSDSGSGKRKGDFHSCVSRLIESLPGSESTEDYSVRLGGELLEKHNGDPGVGFERDRAKNRLVLTSKTAALAECCRRIQPGDFILQVNYEDTAESMAQELACLGRRKGRGKGRVEKSLLIRPASAERAPAYASVIRTPQTLTACIRRRSGEPLPNVQVVLAPYSSPAHLLFTTDIDCTAMGFDGEHLYATPRAREAIRHRWNIVRPEKYMVRGEWRTEARLLKYAMRGFRVVDLGLRPHASPLPNEEVASAAKEAQALMSDGDDVPVSAIKQLIQRVRDTGVHGAQLLLLAKQEEGLRRLLLHEAPLLPAGSDWASLVKLVTNPSNKRSGSGMWRRAGGGDRSEDSQGGDDGEKLVHYHDGYGKATAALVLVNPAKPHSRRIEDARLRGRESSLSGAIEELDLETDRFEVHDWYDGVEAAFVRDEHAALDPAVWKGVGDFRRAD